VPLASRDWASVSHDAVRASRGRNRDDTSIALQRNLPAGDGFGYRVLARTHSEVQANVAYQNDVGTYTLDATHLEGENAARASIAGGVGFVAGYAFASRAVTGSFGVVRVDDYEGVRVTLDNQPVATTNARGYAVLPTLRAYDANPISIVQHDLPLDAAIERLAVEAVPYYRSGVLVEFPVRRANGATFRLRLDDGASMPAGATVDLIGGDSGFPVALDGQVYVTGLGANNRLRATWKERTCEFDLAMPSARDPLPDLGVVACRGVAR
jgi:outer membrane usher protein